jgi:hypothetical protein
MRRPRRSRMRQGLHRACLWGCSRAASSPRGHAVRQRGRQARRLEARSPRTRCATASPSVKAPTIVRLALNVDSRSFGPLALRRRSGRCEPSSAPCSAEIGTEARRLCSVPSNTSFRANGRGPRIAKAGTHGGRWRSGSQSRAGALTEWSVPRRRCHRNSK